MSQVCASCQCVLVCMRVLHPVILVPTSYGVCAAIACWCVCPAGMCIFRYVRPVVCASCSVCHVRVSMYVLCLLHGGLIVSIILTGILQVEND